MRALLAFAAAVVVALSGCTSSPEPLTEPGLERLPGAQFDSEPEQGRAAGAPGPHGEPVREDGSVESGMASLQVPGAWARRTVTLTNGFDGAAKATVQAALSAGGIQVQPGDGDGYRIEILLEARGATEQQARDNLARFVVDHVDTMEAGGLQLSTVVRQEPAPQVVPGLTLGLGSGGWATMLVVLPAGPAYDLAVETASGDISVHDLRGPAFTLASSSGDLDVAGLNAGVLVLGTSSGEVSLAQVQARQATVDTLSGDITGQELRIPTLVASTSSGSVVLQGAFDTLDLDSSSGSLEVEAAPMASGAYRFSTSSGHIHAQLRESGPRAYRVAAETSSGSVDVRLAGSQSQSEDGDRVQVQSPGYDQARIQTVLEASTSSGDITIVGSEAGWTQSDDGQHGHPPGKA
jgi:hypothetical protein